MQLKVNTERNEKVSIKIRKYVSYLMTSAYTYLGVTVLTELVTEAVNELIITNKSLHVGLRFSINNFIILSALLQYVCHQYSKVVRKMCPIISENAFVLITSISKILTTDNLSTATTPRKVLA